MPVLAMLLALVIGLVLGLLGGGGSILTVPLFAYVLGQEPRTAIAGSLLVVGATSTAGMLAHARSGRVRFRVGAVFGAAGMAAAWVGGRAASLLPGPLLLAGFGAMLLVTGGAMLRGRPAATPGAALSASRALLVGAGVGLLAGLFGAGGGFLIVPALVLIGGLEMPEAVGTSLLVIAMFALGGFLGHTGHVELDTTLLASVTAAAVAGTIGGAFAGRFLSSGALRRAFAWLVLGMGLVILGTELRAWVPLPVLLAALAIAGALSVLPALRAARAAATPITKGAHEP